ncbi:EscR/YscR/HrcR family type III secretion system export apparatus protein, partial [Citrobacter freundii]
ILNAVVNTSRAYSPVDNSSLFTLLAAYSLSEIKSAFVLGFYVYLPFIVVDLLVSNVLLALGMMMMSPVTISLPIKLVLFVAIDGWSKIATGMVMQYAALWKTAA